MDIDMDVNQMGTMWSKNALKVLESRYLVKDEKGQIIETPEGMLRRVAKSIASVEKLYGKSDEEISLVEERFFELMASKDFLPNSPTLMNGGTDLQQLSACFVLPLEDSIEQIFETVKNTALIHKSGGGTGFAFSNLRPKSDVVRTTGGIASGPVSFMKVINASTEEIKQGGKRRGANMAVLRVDHPDILEFIDCKKEDGVLNNFNISVAITDAFMKAAKNNEEYELINPRTKVAVGRLNAKEIYDKIIDRAWSNGEPGLMFIDRVNVVNPISHIGQIESTNPCGEQPLLPYESCNLGSINLANMVKEGEEGYTIDYDKLYQTVRESVHFLDNVIDANEYPLDEIAVMTRNNRKIGLGIMGWGHMLYLLGIRYGSEESLALAENIMKSINEEAIRMSEELAKERGAFPNFVGSAYDIRDEPERRNSTVTTVAPTGTLSILAGTSSGIEPVFSLSYIRRVLEGTEMIEVDPIFEQAAKERGFYSEELMTKIANNGGSLHGIEQVPEDIREIFVTAHEISPEEHIRMQAAFQKYVESAISKTVNFPRDATREDVRTVYELAYDLGCKGVTVYRDGSRAFQVLSTSKTKKEDQISEEKSVVVEDTRLGPRPRPRMTRGVTFKSKTGCGTLYVTINEDEQGPAEVFLRIGKSGGCAASQSEATGRLVSLALRSGVSPAAIVKQLRGIRCPNPVWEDGRTILSCSDALSHVLAEYLQLNGDEKTQSDLDNLKYSSYSGLPPECPDCGSRVMFAEGCVTCTNPECGYSKCS
ncbi:MAG: vitamin B12-dependent ribonucleotide reductase [Promethearchaeota archaeon]